VKPWLARWEKHIVSSARTRYCDRQVGEDIGWLVTPFLDGFYYGYMATGDEKWCDMLVDWADSLIKRAVKEPDGFVGWPAKGATGTTFGKDLYTDSQLGEAMAMRPIILMAGEILKRPGLKQRYGKKADEYIQLSERIFAKWNAWGAWREVKDGGLWVIPPVGIDQATGKYVDGYDRRMTDGFTLPANKQNLIARWLIATNRDFMWNQQVQGAEFQRIDGGAPDKRWEKSPGVLWAALTPYDETLRKVFEANHAPDSWGGLAATPWYLWRFGPVKARQ
jgi:hypothetical protein